MDNSDIKDLIIGASAQACGLITLWGLTNYFDKSNELELPIGVIRLFGRDLTITNKIFYQMAFFASSVLCTVNFLKTNKKL
jgi:hypothetical protein